MGGESTRPGAEPVSTEEEIGRVVPVIEGVVQAGDPAQISIDTSKFNVAQAAVRAGATYINDVTALRADPQMAELIAEHDLACCLMHMLGRPRTMEENPSYTNVVDDVKSFLEERLAVAIAAGIKPERIQLDPGIGFGKTLEHNLELLSRLDEIVAIGQPVVIGVSRKSFLGHITGKPTDERLAGTIAANVLALQRGAQTFRVHDVAPVRDALAVATATLTRRWNTTTTTTTTTS